MQRRKILSKSEDSHLSKLFMRKFICFHIPLSSIELKDKNRILFLNSKMISRPFLFLSLFAFSSLFSSLSTCNHILLGKSEIHVTWTTPKGFKNECGFSLLPNWLFLEKDENKPGSFYRYDWHLLRQTKKKARKCVYTYWNENQSHVSTRTSQIYRHS